MECGPWLRSLGFDANEPPLDGTIHRLDRGKSGKSGWFIGWRDPFEFAIAGDWRTGERFEMTAPDSAPLSTEDRRRRKILLDEAQQKSLAGRDERQESARLKADIMWRSGVNGELVEQHEYLTRKKVGAFGVRVLDGELLIPTIDADGIMHGLQRILVDGKKFFLSGQRFDSTFHRILGNRSDRIFVCEGYSTGASIHMATGAMVYCAFSAGNLVKVADLVAMMHAGVLVVIAGDDDRFTEGNPGRKAAIASAGRAKALVMFPAFKSDDGEPTDFNDLHCREGLDVVREVLGMADVETGGVGNVVAIEDDGKRKPGRPRLNRARTTAPDTDRPPPKPKKPKAGELYRKVAEAVMGVSPFPPFPVRYIALEPERGMRIPAIVSEDDSVHVVRAATLATDVLQYCHERLTDGFAFTAKQAREAADVYLGLVEPTPAEDVKIVRWKDEPGMTYRRLPWAHGDGTELAPTWEVLLARMTNAKAFCEWYGSLFFEQSAMQQYVYLFGFGGDGKGAINRFTEKVFQKAYRSKQPPTRGDKFWTHGILGARVVVFADCDDAKFVASGLFKSLTGGDPIDVEAKGEMSFTAKPFAKYMVLGNDRPDFEGQKSNIRRIIFCEMEKFDGFDPLFEERLWIEGGAFLSSCVAMYAAKYPDHGPITTDQTDIKEHTEDLEAHYHEAFREWFRIDQNAHVVPGDMLRLTQIKWRDRKTQLGFIKFIERMHGIKKKTLHARGEGKGYAGIECIKSPFGAELPYQVRERYGNGDG